MRKSMISQMDSIIISTKNTKSKAKAFVFRHVN